MANLGILDVAYIPPQGARRGYHDLWGTDELDFLSRYDGVMYVRLNPLGAYCLGLANTYTPSETDARTQLTILPSLQVNVTSGTLSTEEALLLDTLAEKETETVWRLNKDKILMQLKTVMPSLTCTSFWRRATSKDCLKPSRIFLPLPHGKPVP